MDFLRLRAPVTADVDLASTTPPSSSSCNTSLSSWPYYPSTSKPLATGGGGGRTNNNTRGFDINLPPSNEDDVDDEAEEGGAELAGGRGSSLSPSPARSSVVVPSPPKRKREEEEGYHELALLKTQEESSSRASDDEDGPTRKKLRLTKEQSALLEESFSEHSTLNPKQKSALAKQLNLKPRQVEVWFQNRRARTKLKQTEVDCELLRRCYESLTEENRRLQKEVQELRVLKVGPPRYLSHDYYMSMPATTLSMCPSCEKIAPLDSLTTNNSSNTNNSNKRSSNNIPAGPTAFLTNSTNNVFNGSPIAMPRHQFFQQVPSSSPQLYHQLSHHHHNINLQHSHH